jgi:aryl-alcohol dehydrogenase-like predicted oxidoreductase
MAIKKLGIAGQVHVTTKAGMTRPGGAWVKNGHPAHLRASCEQSLRDLGVERIFLYQLHWPDPDVPYAESVGTLAGLQREGKIEHIGISNVTPAQFKEAQGVVRIESVQNRCSPTDQQDLQNGLLELCEAEQVTYIPYSPMGGGSGHQQMAGQSLLRELGEKYAVSPYQIILAWLLGKSERVIPIPGSSREASIRDSAAAARLALDPTDAARIDALA